MKTVQVFGSGCNNCLVTTERLTQVAHELGIEVNVEKVTELKEIMIAGIVSTPGVAVDGIVKHTGSVPTIEQVRKILA